VLAVVPPEIAEAHHALRAPALDAGRMHGSALVAGRHEAAAGLEGIQADHACWQL
jgi:hypothetical protein